MGCEEKHSVIAWLLREFIYRSAVCDQLLDKLHKLEPQIRGVFQNYVEQELITKHKLSTPLGRVRDFLALRSYSDNSKVFRDAYSYIPQSTVGDNTGLAILFLEKESPGIVIADHHDAVGVETDDEIDKIVSTVGLIQDSFHRVLQFYNGYSVEIGIEFELGYSLGEMITIEKLDRDGIARAIKKAKLPYMVSEQTGTKEGLPGMEVGEK